MKIVFVSPRFHTNEAHLVRRLRDDGHDLRMYVHESKHSEDHSTLAPEVLGYSSASGRLHGDAARLKYGLFPRGTISRVASESPDVVVIKGFRLASLLLSWGLALRAIPRVIHVQRDAARLPGLKQRVYQRLFGPVVVTPVSTAELEATGKPVREWIGQRWFYAPFVADAVPQFGVGADQTPGLRVLVVGKMQERKKILETVSAVRELRAEGREISLTIVGTVLDRNYYRRVMQQVEGDAGITVRTAVPHAEMAKVYESHDVFVLPSVREAASYSQLEAMAHGLPVIICSDNGTANYVLQGETGFVVDPADLTAEIASRLRALDDDPEDMRRMGRAGLTRVRDHHTAQAFGAAIRAATTARAVASA